MMFNSLTFLVFFPFVLLGYFVAPRRLRYLFLLAASFIFYMWWNPYYVSLLIVNIILTWICSLILAKFESKLVRRGVIATTLVINLTILGIFKYNNFGASLVNAGFAAVGLTPPLPHFDIILPVGISFFTFQALGYIIDVYRGETKPEKNPFKYALFVSFFPQMVAGPIERSKNLLTQIQKIEQIRVARFNDLYHGLVAILFGFFMKVVVSDRIAILVDTVYNSWWNYHSFELWTATIGFALQIYTDFGAYSIIALGAARMMGIRLMENFEQPYFARSIREFWRRWHISLSTWFRDYLYIPLGGNRKGPWRKRLNVMIVFCTSGLWHGAGASFLVWGFLHGLYQVAGDVTAPLRRKVRDDILHVKTMSFSYKLLQVLITFLLVCIAWVAFRAPSLMDTWNIWVAMFTDLNPWAIFNGTLFSLGIDRPHFSALGIGIVVLFLVDRIRYRKGILLGKYLQEQILPFRWAALLGMFLYILVFGAWGEAYDASDFIYFQF